MGLVAAWVQRFPACILTPPKPPPRLFSTYPSRSGASVDHFMVSRFDGESRFQAGGVKSRSAPAVSDGICSLPVAQFRVCSERLAQCFFAMPPLEQCGECVEMAAVRNMEEAQVGNLEETLREGALSRCGATWQGRGVYWAPEASTNIRHQHRQHGALSLIFRPIPGTDWPDKVMGFH